MNIDSIKVMTPINISLKETIMSYLNKRSKQTDYCIEGINPKKQEEVMNEILSYLNNKHYFVYKDGSTKFNDKLFIVSKKELGSYLFDAYYTIYDPSSLSYLNTGYLDVYIRDENNIVSIKDNQLSIVANGVFEGLLLHISSMFEYIESESKLPKK